MQGIRRWHTANPMGSFLDVTGDSFHHCDEHSRYKPIIKILRSGNDCDLNIMITVMMKVPWIEVLCYGPRKSKSWPCLPNKPGRLKRFNGLILLYCSLLIYVFQCQEKKASRHAHTDNIVLEESEINYKPTPKEVAESTDQSGPPPVIKEQPVPAVQAVSQAQQKNAEVSQANSGTAQAYRTRFTLTSFNLLVKLKVEPPKLNLISVA